MFWKTKIKPEPIKTNDEKLSDLPKRYSKTLTPSEEEIVSKELALFLKDRGLLDLLQKAGSVDNIQDPIDYRRVFNAIYEFCLKNNISLDDPPEERASLSKK
jgi:hypothetical protein